MEQPGRANITGTRFRKYRSRIVRTVLFKISRDFKARCTLSLVATAAYKTRFRKARSDTSCVFHLPILKLSPEITKWTYLFWYRARFRSPDCVWGGKRGVCVSSSRSDCTSTRFNVRSSKEKWLAPIGENDRNSSKLQDQFKKQRSQHPRFFLFSNL